MPLVVVGGLILPPSPCFFCCRNKGNICQTFTCWVVLPFWKMFTRFEWQAVNSQPAHKGETQRQFLTHSSESCIWVMSQSHLSKEHGWLYVNERENLSRKSFKRGCCRTFVGACVTELSLLWGQANQNMFNLNVAFSADRRTFCHMYSDHLKKSNCDTFLLN